MSRRFVVSLGLAALVAASTGAHAQDSLSPRERFERAVAHYEAERFQEALTDFQRLYATTGESGLLYNIARCHEELGEIDAAIESLEGYLDAVESGPDREDALTRLVALERRRRAAGDTAASEEPTEEPAGGSTSEAPAEEGAGATDQISVTPPAEPSGGLSTLSTVGVALVAVGGAGLVVGAILGGVTAAEHGRLSEECAPACEEDQLSDLRAFGVGADISLIGGGVIAVTGLALLIAGLDGGGGEESAVRLRGSGVEVRF
jgi:hypothetical protein